MNTCTEKQASEFVKSGYFNNYYLGENYGLTVHFLTADGLDFVVIDSRRNEKHYKNIDAGYRVIRRCGLTVQKIGE